MNVHYHVSVLKDLGRAERNDPVQPKEWGGRYIRPDAVDVKTESDRSAERLHLPSRTTTGDARECGASKIPAGTTIPRRRGPVERMSLTNLRESLLIKYSRFIV